MPRGPDHPVGQSGPRRLAAIERRGSWHWSSALSRGLRALLDCLLRCAPDRRRRCSPPSRRSAPACWRAPPPRRSTACARANAAPSTPVGRRGGRPTREKANDMRVSSPPPQGRQVIEGFTSPSMGEVGAKRREGVTCDGVHLLQQSPRSQRDTLSSGHSATAPCACRPLPSRADVRARDGRSRGSRDVGRGQCSEPAPHARAR
jgi:hypothetical protein